MDGWMDGWKDRRKKNKVNGLRLNTWKSHHQSGFGQWHSGEKIGRAKEEEKEQAYGKVKKRTAKGQRQMSK